MEPVATTASEPFWEATRDKRLVIQWCLDCEQPVHFPREVCPRCLGTRLEYRPSAGTAIVHTVVVEHKVPSPMGGDGPYAIALVDLDEGVRLMTNVVGIAPADVTVGMAVQVAWEPLSDGRHLPLFEPLGSGR
jgi:hypothetical protein